MLTVKSAILDAQSMERTLIRIAHQIIEKCDDRKTVSVIGIRRRGVPLAKEIAKNIELYSDIKTELGELDITLYRDDLGEFSEQPTVNSTDIPFDVNGKTIILVDDVLYTGRTARAAIDALIALGRPACIKLCVLIDRGHRELPIRGDFVGKNVPTSKKEMISVRLPEYDGVKDVIILENT